MNLQSALDAIMRSAEFDLVSHAHFHSQPFLISRHFHEDLYQFSYLVNGVSRIVVKGKPYAMSPGDALCVRPRQWHGPDPKARGERTEVMNVKFSLEQNVSWSWPAVFSVDSRMEYQAIFEGMLCEYHMHRPLRESMLRSYLVQLVLILSRSIPENRPAGLTGRRERLSIRNERKVRVAMDLLRQHYRQAHSLKALAAAVGMSASALSHSFKMLTGVSPIQYLVNYRLSQALRLMTSTDTKLDSVADAVGFATAGYLCRAFKKRFKRPPRDYVRGMSDAASP
jgi:AraC-like DNA-binding protein